MADVDRGQFIAVAGLVLAVVLVSLALVLNSAIYTGNVATQETNHDPRSAMDQQAAIDDAVGQSMQYVNVHHPSAPHDNLTEEIEAIDGRFQREVMRGEVVTVRVTDRSNGTRIAQTNANRNFTDRNRNQNWRLVDDTEGTHQFDMQIERSSLYDAGLTATWDQVRKGSFQVNVTDESGDTWRVYIYRSSVTGSAYLATKEPGGGLAGDSMLFTFLEGSCVAGGSNVTVDFVHGIYGGEWIMNTNGNGNSAKARQSNGNRGGCSELAFYDPAENYTLEYDDADAIQGRYELLVDATSVDTTPYYDPIDDASPFVHTAIRESTVTMDYRTAEVDYRVTWTAEPRIQQLYIGSKPHIEQFNVTDNSTNSSESALLDTDQVQYEVDWRVTDASGDLENGTVYLYNNDRNETEAKESLDNVDGGVAQGSLTLDGDSAGYGDEYTVRIEVEDELNQIAAASVEDDAADGEDP